MTRSHRPQRSLTHAIRLIVLSVTASLLTATCTKESPTPRFAAVGDVSPGTPAILMGDVSRIDSVLTADRGKWVLLNVWATWCKPCVAETPSLVRLTGSLKGHAFAIVGVSMDFAVASSESDATTAVAGFVARQHVSYPNIIYKGSIDGITQRFSLGGAIPVSILFDPQGREVERWEGILETSDFDVIRAKVS